MRRSHPFLLVGAMVLLAFLLSCSEKLAKRTDLSASDLYERGRQKLAAKKFGDAAEAFQVLLERFPTSPIAAKAQLGLADARMGNKNDVEAEVAFDDFLRLYPADDNVAYALFRKGELLARQASDPGRDQARTREAVKALTKALEKDPKGPYAPQAAAQIAKLRNRLGEHERRVVSHYLRRKRYAAAEGRARRALAEYPDTDAAPPLMSMLAEALEKQGKKAEAAEIRKLLVEKFPAAGGKKR